TQLPPLTVHTQNKEYSFPKDFAAYKLTLIYFYPRDNTPGCTRQAKGYRDYFPKFQAAGVQIFGVSIDSVDSHKRFSDRFNLPFPLISDTDLALTHALSVNSRDTFLVDNTGTVVAAWRKVSPDEATIDMTLERALSYIKEQA
ncbi:MAG: peroxiredoxin, partial [Proteobacteria bacterium]|nr:peroxiredoxin [Pseudomonadota bacterium]